MCPIKAAKYNAGETKEHVRFRDLGFIFVCCASLLSITSCAIVSPKDYQLIPDSEMVVQGSLSNIPSSVANPADLVTEASQEKSPLYEQAPAALPTKKKDAVVSEALFAADEPPAISLSVDGLPLPMFINEVFANQLKLDFQMAPEVSSKQDLVTLRVTEPRNRQGVFDLASQVLASYGVLVVQEGALFRFVLGNSKGAISEPPLILTGAALPSVPSTHRPVFWVRTLNVISNSDAYSMLRVIFEKQGLKVERDNNRNAVTLQGTPSLVKSAADVLEMLDQPAMRGRHTMRIEPAFTDVETLSKSIQSTMSAQGYDIGETGKNIALIPIKPLNSLFVFAPNEGVLSMVKKWSQQLDRVAPKADKKDSFYWYQVRNIGAAQLATTLNAINTGTGAISAGALAGGNAKPNAADGGKGQVAAASYGSFVVDPARNMLLFRGESEKWQELLPLIRDLDQAPAQVMVEVVVAEVTLSESFKFGFEWAVNNVGVGADVTGTLSSVFGTSGVGSGIGGTGLSWASVSSSGKTRVALNAFASDNNVSILQTPKVLVRSGESASVNVGQKIPVLTSRTAEDEVVDGSSSVSQQIEYRDVGIRLGVTPTVFSDGRIDMVVSQEVSASIGDESTNALTPVITTRNIETTLSLQDGGSVLLGGLIAKNKSKGNSRVPVLGSLPWIGQFFRTDSTSADTTELMILIVPYLVNEPAQAEALTQSFRKQLVHHPENN